MNDDKHLQNRLKVLLAERDLKIKDVMQATGLSRSSLSNMANNRHANISLKNIEKFCKYLDISIDKLYEWK